MHLDPYLPHLVSEILIILAIAMLLRFFRQPNIVGYLLSGILLGPHVLGMVTDLDLISRLGSLGTILLLFFVGMEVSPSRLMANWKVAIFGTLVQILLSVLCIWLLGALFDWPLGRRVLIGFVISLSSTAVVLRILQDNGELDTKAGQNALGILLVQDLAVVPMQIIVGLMGGEAPTLPELVLQSTGGVLMIVLMALVFIKRELKLPFLSHLRKDPEMQVFVALTICFGMATLTGLFGLSTALGAFAGGMLVTAAKETHWVHHSLEPFRVVFISLFFVAVGLMLDLNFLVANIWQVLILGGIAFLTNTVINALVLRAMGDSRCDAFYTAILLAQIGEFSFVLAAVGLQAQVISQHGYQLTLAVIASTLLITPLWTALSRRLLFRSGCSLN